MENHFLDELHNQFARVHDLATEATEWSSRPAWIEFAPNNVCNLRCIMCGQSDEEHWPLHTMPKERAAEILDELLPHASVLTPSDISEPMLNNIRLLVEKCREHDAYLNFNTNATLMTGARIRELADRVHHLFISIDSHIPEVFERIRVRAEFATVVRNIRDILAVSKDVGFPVDFVAVMMTENLPHLDGLVDFIADLGGVELACELRIQLAVGLPPAGQHLDPFASLSEAEIAAHLDRATARAAERGLRFRAELPPPLHRSVQPRPPRFRWVMGHLVNCLTAFIRATYPQFCSMAAYHMKIGANGNVYPCCRAPEELVMGNVHEESPAAIWNGARYREFRRRMFAGDYLDVCRGCDVLTANPAFRAPPRS